MGNAAALERECGPRYRREQTDRGLGHTWRELQAVLADWGFAAGERVCRQWLLQYRLGDGARDGGASLYILARNDLRRWYHVDGLRGVELTDKYRSVYGVFTHPTPLVKWLNAPAQVLEPLDNNEDHLVYSRAEAFVMCLGSSGNFSARCHFVTCEYTGREDIHGHDCGQYTLDLLQQGRAPEDVVALLREGYLVRTTRQRVVAYRYYREQRSEYWTLEKLEQDHWSFLYEQVGLTSLISRTRGLVGSPLKRMKLEAIRTEFCGPRRIAEELVPVSVLQTFYGVHEAHAQMRLRYADATVVRDTLEPRVVQAYRVAWGGEAIADSSKDSILSCLRDFTAKSELVASGAKLVVFPLACAQAAFFMAYTLLRCAALFAGQCWMRSRVSEVQREFSSSYPRVDFEFWVKYGSWSQCPSCGSYHFNDRYFKQLVYQSQGTSAKPDKLAAYRRQVPSDPVEHGPGKVGISSRWWYLPGMYHPAAQCTHCTEPRTVDPGRAFSEQLRRRITSKRPRGDASGGVSGGAPSVSRTQELYRVPRIAEGPPPLSWAKEVVTWPRCEGGAFRLGGQGASMLELTQDEADALCIVIVNTAVRQEKYGAAHQLNWKKNQRYTAQGNTCAAP